MKKCKCKKKRCLSGYCVCFAGGETCNSSCKCSADCSNSSRAGDLKEREEAIQKYYRYREHDAIKRQKTEAAETQLGSSSPATSNEAGSVGSSKVSSRSRGNISGPPDHCACRKSQCLKKYCVCFAEGRKCDAEKCKCVTCHNTTGDLGEELQLPPDTVQPVLFSSENEDLGDEEPSVMPVPMKEH